MAPKFIKTESVSWWQKEDAYIALDYINVQYELVFGKDLIKPGDLIKIKNRQGMYRFRCLAHHVKLDKTWVDCMDISTGAWNSIRVDKIKCLVKPKQTRKKRSDAKV